MHFIYLLNIFPEAGDVTGFIADGFIEVAEFASRNAGIGDVHIAVDDPCDPAMGMMFLPEFIRYPHQIS